VTDIGRLILRSWVGVVLLAAGCGGDGGDGDSRPGATSRTELQWVEAYADWGRDLSRGLDRVVRAYQPVYSGAEVADEVEEALEVALACAGDFRDEVGKPPTPRLEPVHALTVDACAELRAWRERVLDSLEGDPSDHVLVADAHGSQAEQLLARAAEALRGLAGDGRPLPVHGRPTPESHIAPPYSRAAAVVSYREDVEARCWSEDDWSEVVRVMSALDPGHHVDYAGLASPGDARISLAPDICVDLALLAYTDRRPTDGDDLYDLAAAVLTLAHEAMHVRAPALSEAAVNCAALQEVRRTARALGASTAYAALLAEAAWEDVYPDEPSEYVTEACRDGGPLDADPGSTTWP
jgi:hypothetical protein